MFHILALLWLFILTPALAAPPEPRPGNSEYGRSHNHGAPGPLLAAGIPSILLFAGTYWCFNRIRNRRYWQPV